MEHGDATTSNGGSTSDGHDSKGRHYAIGAGFLANTQAGNFGSAISRHFNNILPPHKRYFNNRISRRTLLIIIGVTCICLLALIIGLAAGLSHHPDDTALPLPGGSQVIKGDLTYYNPALGACGETHGDGDAVVAVSHLIWDAEQSGSNPNTNPLCGRKIRARRFNEKTGKDASIDVTVIDRCTGCAAVDIDVSPAMFDKMADPAKGRVTVDATLEPLYSSEKPLPVPPEQSCSSEPAERDLSSRVSSNVDVWVPDNKRNEDQAQPKTEPYDESFRYSRSIYNPISFASLDFGTFEEISLDSEPPEETEPEDDMAGRKTVKISLFLSSFAILVSAIALIFFGLIFEKYKSLESVLGKSIVVDAPSITPVTSPTVPPPPVQETAINPEPADDPTSVILLAPIRKTSELEMSDAVTSSFTSSSTLSPTTSSLSSSETDAPSSSIASILLQPSDTEFLLRRSDVEPHLAFPKNDKNDTHGIEYGYF
ncbi:riboflavin aldehyde-forming enzyme protein [Stemphylium lycopersici]|nr:riboflavin aldehyde-forming enzyme protein [Stemphylium lycopersici]RAQ99044.1 riboflavin aldehyde-forming enzyme protein [Stemphylium lycopersici]